MEDSHQKLKLKYQSLDTDSLIELHRSGGQPETAHSALREELSSRGFKFLEESPKTLKPNHCSDKPKSSKRPVWTVWFRLISTLSIFFMMALTMHSTPIRGNRFDSGEVIVRCIKVVLIGPGLMFYRSWEAFGVLFAAVYWLLLLGTAYRSNDDGMRRRFYKLLAVYIVMTLIGGGGAIGLGLIAMAGAM